MTTNSSWRTRVARKLREALQLVGMLLVALAVVAAIAGLWLIGDSYTENGFRNCRANGSSYTWCHATIKWQSFKALF